MALGMVMTAAAVRAGFDAGPFLRQHCVECHDADSAKGGLDLTAPGRALGVPSQFDAWVRIHDRVASGDMPPAKVSERPSAEAVETFTAGVAGVLKSMDRERLAREGRAVQRRLNRDEFEQTLRDLLQLPALEVRGFLPQDGTREGFPKVAEGLDVSFVQMSRTIAAADFALRQAMAPQAMAPARSTRRFYAWDQGEFFGVINLAGPKERRTLPLVGLELQRELMTMARPERKEAPDAERREKESMGVVVSTYEPTEIRFGRFRAPVTGRYRLRVSAYSFWIDPKFTEVTRGRRAEPVTLYSDSSPRILRWLGSFDVGVEPTVRELDVELLAGETIRPDAARLHRSRPPDHKNPLTTPEGMPGVAFQWLEVDGPLFDSWPPAGHRLLFGDLPMEDRPVSTGVGRSKVALGVEVRSADPAADASRLMSGFVRQAWRRPVKAADVEPFVALVRRALAQGHSFTEAMIAGYTSVLCSPGFLFLNAPKAGRLDNAALAERLSYFLWNSAPDAGLRAAASEGRLQRADELRAEVDRLLDDPRSSRFIEAFLDSWLGLRGIANTAPDADLYPEYQLDDLLVESMSRETQLYFHELLLKNLPVTALVDADFAFLNERLARHYGIAGIEGVELRRAPLPAGNVRGGLLTQASVLKVTANGTTTSPVKRGAWVQSQLLGRRPPPPPPGVPAVEPDIRGATTIREQLARHRTQESCNGCHRRIDPAGFALENFDVMGGWRDRYRTAAGGEPVKGIGHDGLVFRYGLGPAVDPSGELPDGRRFADIRELKACLAAEPGTLAGNLALQWIVYATGAPITFADRVEIEKILNRTRRDGYRLRSILHEIVQSELFLSK